MSKHVYLLAVSLYTGILIIDTILFCFIRQFNLRIVHIHDAKTLKIRPLNDVHLSKVDEWHSTNLSDAVVC